MRSLIVVSLLFILILFSGTTGAVTKKKNTHKVASSAEDICPILIGTELPEITLETADKQLFNLNEAVFQKSTVLIVYRGSWSPFCTIFLAQIEGIQQDLLGLGYQIIAFSADRPEKLKEFKGKSIRRYTLLSDRKMTAAKALGLAFRVPDDVVKLYKQQYQIDLEEASGEPHHILPVPAVFIINTNGVVLFEFINPNYKDRINPEVLLAAAESYRNS